MHVQLVASFSPIVRDSTAARAFYGDALGLTFEGGEGDYVFTEQLAGVKHFGLWPLREAARACFGTEEWPPHLPVPQASLEFEVEDVAAHRLTTAVFRCLCGILLSSSVPYCNELP